MGEGKTYHVYGRGGYSIPNPPVHFERLGMPPVKQHSTDKFKSATLCRKNLTGLANPSQILLND
jgi:hypothetical protein